MANCKECGANLDNDEIAIYIRLIDRKAKEFLCKKCLAIRLGCDVLLIDEKIHYYREHGCFLFPKEGRG